MARKKVLITGGTGLLALNWACAIRDNHDVVLATHTRSARLEGTVAMPMPLDDPRALEAALAEVRPDIIVHTAGITSVEQCEREPGLAHHVHAALAHNVATAAARLGARLIHISTDHLFTGTHSLYTETDPPEPVNVYGRTKLLAEETAAAACPQALIVRTNFFGWGHRYRQSFSDWLYYALIAGEPLTLFDDVFISPVLADRLALFSHGLLEVDASGIYNVVGDERISKYDFGIALARIFGLPESKIRRGKIGTSPLSVRRPPDMSLENAKARKALGTPLGSVGEYLRLLRQQDVDGRRTELFDTVSP